MEFYSILFQFNVSRTKLVVGTVTLELSKNDKHTNKK
jgi:hypothetical protein